MAQSYGAKVLHYEWVAPGNKGAARNMGIEAAVSQWIVVVDADEVVLYADKLREVLLQMPAEVGAMNARFINVDENEHVILEWYQMRVFRRGYYRYIHREHEIPMPCKDDVGDIYTINVTFEHRPPTGRATPKVGAMLARLELDVEKHPDDPHSLYMLARQYGHAEQWQESINAVDKYMRLPGARMKSDAARLAGISNLRLGNRHAAYEWWHRATAYEPKRRLLWIELAQFYFDDRHYELALALARMAAELPKPLQQRETQPVEQLTYICQFIEHCQHELTHSLAHSHTH